MINAERKMRSLLLLSILVLLAIPIRATACSCIWERDTMVTAEMLADTSIHIFIGNVVSSKVVSMPDELGRKTWYSRVTIRISEIFKSGTLFQDQTITIYTGTDLNLDCGIPFKKGETYFIVSFDSPRTKGLFTNYCYPTKPLAEAGRDVARLKN